MIGMCLERGGGELLDQAADGIAVRAQASLFDDYIALFVKLTHHRMKESFRFQISPQFKPVLGQRVVVIGLVFGSVGVHVFAAVLLDNFAEFIGFDELVG